MDASQWYQAYLAAYSPEKFLQFYGSLTGEFLLDANPDRIVPIAHAPVLLDETYRHLFAELTSVIWNLLGNRTYQAAAARCIPAPLRDPGAETAPSLPFDPDNNIGCIDFHLVEGRLRMIEYMVLPPGMGTCYPGMLSRYGEYLERLLPGYEANCFEPGWDRRGVEGLMLDQVTGSGKVRRVAIVDWEPETQITLGEFRYLRSLLMEEKRIPAVIADPREVTVEKGRVHAAGQPVDRIVNRVTLVDWQRYLDEIPVYTRLLWERPELFVHHPYLWYLGDKGCLERLSDPSALTDMGLSPSTRHKLLEAVPTTVRLAHLQRNPSDGADLASLLIERFGDPAHIVLKPISSHASRGILLGPVDTPTEAALRTALGGIDPEEYVAMEYVPAQKIEIPAYPGERRIWQSDIRIFALNGKYLYPGSRIYYGDYTNQNPCRGFGPLFFC